MSTIKISNLYPVGSELFLDSESLLKELTDDEMNLTGGFRSFTRPPRLPCTRPPRSPFTLPTRSVPIIHR